VRDGDFIEELRRRCQATPAKIAFADSDDPRIFEVASRMLTEGSVREVVMLTKKVTTLAAAHQYGHDLARFKGRVKWASDSALPTPARLELAAEMLAKGQIDAVLGGNIATTAEVIRAGISGVGLSPGVRTVSGAFILHRLSKATDGSTQTYLFADCGVVIAPTVRQLADIATESVKTWRQLFPSNEAIVSFLSFSTKGSAAHEAATRMAEATALFKAQHPEVTCDGELQFDAAFDPAIGQRKAPGSPVPGRTNCFIFPDLGAGNIAYKITQRLGGFEAYGPILQGMAKPFNDLSRGATVSDILASAYITLARRANAG